MRLIDADDFRADLMNLWDYNSVDGITAETVLKQVLHDLDNAKTVDAMDIATIGYEAAKERCIAKISFDKEQLQEIVDEAIKHFVGYYTRQNLTDFLSFLYSRQTYKDEHKDGDGWSMADLIYLADEYCEGLNNEKVGV